MTNAFLINLATHENNALKIIKNDENITVENYYIEVIDVYVIDVYDNISFAWDESDLDGNIIYYECIIHEGKELTHQISFTLIDKMEMFENSIPNKNEIKSVVRALDVAITGLYIILYVQQMLYWFI